MQGHTDYEGGYIQARWTRTVSAGNESVLQFSYDKTDLSYPYMGGGLNNLTFYYWFKGLQGRFARRR